MCLWEHASLPAFCMGSACVQIHVCVCVCVCVVSHAGKMADNVGGLRLQLAEAKGLLADAIGKYAGNVTKLG